MNRVKQHASRPGWKERFAATFRSFARNERGATIVVIALVMPVLIGAMALAVEISYWHWRQRAMQNAADAAAIAAATNGGPTYDNEANAVTAKYGFQNGVGNITVSATNPATAPGCTANCYSVQVSDEVP
jgi:Flp pilus assembly protein TadG